MKKFYLALFLLAGFLFGLISCTKEAEINQLSTVLSPSEATALLAQSIQSTEDDVIYLDITSEQAKKMGITDNFYRDALAQIETLNQSIRESKKKGITVVNGFKTKNLITKNGFPGGGGGGGVDPENPGGGNQPYPHRVYRTSDYLYPNQDTRIDLGFNTLMYSSVLCNVKVSLSDSYFYYEVYVYCINSQQTRHLIGAGPAPPASFSPNDRPDESPKDWQFIATVIKPNFPVCLDFVLENKGPQ